MLKELRAQYKAKLAALRTLATAGITDANRTEYTNTEAEMRALGARIEQLTEIDSLEAEVRSREEAEERARQAGRPTLPQPGQPDATGNPDQRSAEERDREHRAAFRSYMLTGSDAQLRAQSIYTGSAGGYAIPVTLNPELDRALLTYGGLAASVRQLNTATGEPINWPGSDNTSLSARVVNENTDAPDTNVTMNNRQLTVNVLGTGVVKVPRPLLNDSLFDFETFVREELGESYGRGLADYCTGVATDAAFDNFYNVITAGPASLAAGAIGLQDIYNLFGAVDAAYANSGSFVMNRTTQLNLSAQRNDLGAPIFPLDANGMLTNLLGRPIVIDTNAPNIAAGNRAIAFGNLQKYILRKVPGMEIMRLDERFATANQVAFLGFLRAGSKYINSGKNPIKALVQKAS